MGAQVDGPRFELLDGGMGGVPPLSVLIIGAGKSGKRFLRALTYLQRVGVPINVVGVSDLSVERLAGLGRATQIFTDASEALTVTQPDVVLVCVNESAHYEILEAISRRGRRTRLVMCEKPLTETLEQFDHIDRLFAPGMITVNFVERHSPVVADFVRWRDQHSIEILRAEFFWGKYRYRDERPTMGVLSEISHPIDLVRVLAGFPETVPVEVREVSMSHSDFSCLEDEVSDSVSVAYSMGPGVLVRGYSSFLWEGRDRRVVLYGRGPDGGVYQAVLAFDNPRWDQDQLTIWSLNSVSGQRSTILQSSYTNSDFPGELDQVYKVTRFAHESLRHLVDPSVRGDLVTLSGARWVQELIDRMAAHASQGLRHSVAFGAR